MKTAIQTAVVIITLIILGVLFIPKCPPEGYVNVRQTWLDSLQAIANLPPDTIIKIDTFKMPYPVYVDKPIPTPVIDGDKAFYQDTLKDEQVLIVLRDTLLDNRIVFRRWEYQLFVPLKITQTITINQPVPMPYPVVERVSFKYYAGVDFGTDGLALRGGVFKGRFAFGGYGGKDRIGASGIICF